MNVLTHRIKNLGFPGRRLTKASVLFGPNELPRIRSTACNMANGLIVVVNLEHKTRHALPPL